MSAAHRLGAFTLLSPIGEGGMGAVFRAVHEKSGAEVAVKVMSAESAREARALAAFRREVRAVAALTHGNIVSVLDHDVLPFDVATTEPPVLVPGSPYLVMELAEATLAGKPPERTYEAVHDVLLALLDALSHAHAHGIIHRDIKPANVLWVRSPEGALRPKLSDFGLAHAVRMESEFGRGAGTPAYMAPEQFRAAVREFGPWTDLYSMGCLAYFLLSGKRPFEDKEDAVLAHRHLTETPAPLEPLFPVPEGLHAWVERLLEKNPLARYRFAADAAHALRSLGDAPHEGASTTTKVTPRATLLGEKSGSYDAGAGLRAMARLALGTDPDDTDTTPTFDARRPSTDRPPMLDEAMRSGLVAAPPSSVDRLPTEPPPRVGFDPALHAPPPLPATWRRPTEVMPLHLLGAGLGLFGLRALPLVGRVRERDVLWHTLARVTNERRPEVVVLAGPAGYGKSKLAEWLEHRAHEVGAAHTMSATHERGGRGRDALVELARHHLGVRGLDWAGASQRIKQYMSLYGIMDEHERRALTDLVASSPTGDARGRRVVPAYAEHALLLRMLDRASLDRPLVVRLEDVQWGADTLAFVEHVLDTTRLPVLFVLTVQDESVAADPTFKARLASFARRVDVSYLPVGPLPASDQATLVTGLLHLGGALADAVVERTAGNPMFARELVGDWVQRGVLALAEEGFVLREGESATLPDSLYDVWSGHVDRVVRGDPDLRAALELAAVAGMRVHAAEWRLACQLEELSVESGFLDRLLSARLVVLEDDGAPDLPPSFRFTHGMLRECLERAATEANRIETHHAALAEMLLPRFETGEVEVAERLAVHLRFAGRLEEALEPLRAAVELSLAQAEVDRAVELVAMHARIVSDLALPDTHRTRAENAMADAEVRAALGAFDDAAALADRALAIVEASGSTDLVPRALEIAGHVAWHRGRTAEAEARLTDALQRFDALAAPAEAARCLRGLAVIAVQEGRNEVAFNAYLHSLELCRTLDDAAGVAASLAGMGLTDPSRETGNAAYVKEALDVYEGRGYVFGVAAALNALGEIARREQKLPEAEALFRRALEVAHGLGAGHQQSIVGLNLALVLLRRHKVAEARTELAEALRRAEQLGHHNLLVVLHAALLVALGTVKDAKALRHHVWATRTLLESDAPVEIEAVTLLEEAAICALDLDALDAADIRKLALEAKRRASATRASIRNFLTRG